MKKRTYTAILFATLLASPSFSQDNKWDNIRQVTTHIGEMTSTLSSDDAYSDDRIGFEPFQLYEDMFDRDDVVFLMRHGPTDWSKRDEYNVAPDDCENQRVMTEEGKGRMTRLGEILANNDIFPSQIVVSEWCRNHETHQAFMEGIAKIDPERAADLPFEVDPNVNLLLSLQGAPSVQDLKERITNWDGNPDRSGPLLIISHYTNIEELTQFRVFEGEALVIDPKRDNRVIGYFRLASAGPDEGHFADTLESPLLEDNEVYQMVERFYSAVGNQDLNELDSLLSDGWVSRGLSGDTTDQSVTDFVGDVQGVTEGLTDRNFAIEEIYTTDDVVTVVGMITGKHTGEIFGVPATGNEVSFGTIAVHRLVNGQISESWQVADRVSLIQQLSQ